MNHPVIGKRDTRRISIRTLRHRSTGMLVAVSDVMKGLYVHGDTEDELMERVPVAIQALLEAEGYKVFEVAIVESEIVAKLGFVDSERTYNASVSG